MFIESFAPSLAPTTSLPSAAPSRTPSLSPTSPTTFAPSSSPVSTMRPTRSPTELRGEKSFYAYKVSTSFDEAKSFCEWKGMELASVLNDEERKQASKTIPHGQKGWIGLSWPFYWTDGSALEYTAWESGTSQPVTIGTCVFLYGGNGPFGYYTENACSETFSIQYIVCHEYDRYVPPPQSGLPKYYRFYETKGQSWLEAKAFCMDRGMKLATIMNAEEQQDALFTFCKNNPDCIRQVWIGLRRNQANLNEFLWVDGSPMTFSAWALGEPNNAGNEDCVQFSGTKWNDIPCSTRFKPVLCETNMPPTLAPTSMRPSRSPTGTSAPSLPPTLAPTSMRPSRSPTGTSAPSNSPTYPPNKVMPGRTKGYWVIPGEFAWTDGYQMCEDRGMRFASILNPTELGTAIRALTSSERATDNCYIGSRRESDPWETFEWIYGVPMDFTNWAPPEPYAGLSCVVVTKDMTWITESCGTRIDVLCEYDASMPLSAIPQNPSNDTISSEACVSAGNITTSLRGNKLGDSTRVLTDGIPILYDVCTNHALPWFQRAVAFRYEINMIKSGNYSFSPVIQLAEDYCQEVWISMAVSSYSCDILPTPTPSSVIACSSWALGSAFGTPPLSIQINERKVLNFHLEFRATSSDHLDDCLQLSNMSLNVTIVSNSGDDLMAWIAVMVISLCLLGIYWLHAGQNIIAIFVGLLMVSEMFALIGYLAFAGVTQSVEIAMICLFIVPGIFAFGLMKFRARQGESSSSNSTCSFLAWRIVQEFTALLHAALTCGFFPHAIAEARDRIAPSESSDERLDLLLVAYVCRFIFLTIPMLICVIVNSVDVGVTEEWPFIFVIAISLPLVCVYLTALLTRSYLGPSQEEILSICVLFGDSFMSSNNMSRNQDPESASPPASNEFRTNNNPTSSLPVQSTRSSPLSRYSYAAHNTDSGVRFAANDADDLYEPDWGDSKRFAAFKQDQNYAAFFPEENQVPSSAASSTPSMDCGICFSSGSDMMALNCGHIVCQDCLVGLRREHRPCPFCRKPITSTIKLYV